jgi:3'-phosphoadenosine 5'-phosphosulfate sulfotransferase (PAPS reductase)/FAD synthetase
MFHDYPLKSEYFPEWKEKKTYELCKYFISRQKNVSLALSFGKDSMTILHILYKFNLLNKLKMVMWNSSGFDGKEILKLRDYVLKKYAIKNYVETKVENPEKYIDIKEIFSHKKNTLIDFTYNVLEVPRWEAMDKKNIDGTILGIRKEESRTRAIHVCMRGYEYYNKRELARILQPIARWRTEEIFCYAYKENIPIHPVYNRAKEKQLDFLKQRVNTLIDLNLTCVIRAFELKLLYPEEYNNIIKKFPEIGGMI